MSDPQLVPLDMDELIRMLGAKDVEILQLRCQVKRQAAMAPAVEEEQPTPPSRRNGSVSHA